MDIVQQPDSFCFSSALQDIIVRTNENIDVSFRIQGQEPFLEETYSPDAGNTIRIRELGKLFLPYISKVSLCETFIIRLTGNTDACFITTTVLYGLTEINADASGFLSTSFLTLLPGEKITFPEQKEYLSLVTTTTETVTLLARRESGVTESKTLTVPALKQAITLDVSPSVFNSPETIVYYTAIVGDRAFTYYIRRPSVPEPVQFLFLNSFGVQETFIPSGLLLRENNYENQFGVLGGLYIKYNVELVKEYTANTGILNESMADWIEELFASRDVFLLSPDGGKKEITITEATVKRSSARDALPACEFKYRLSKFNHMEYTPPNRIFDDTHNYSFN
jgi:hypothetical protein